MAKIDKDTIDRWIIRMDAFLASKGYTRADVTLGTDAWACARGAGIMEEAYSDRSIIDAHIQTALETILPNVTFKDRKVY